SINASPAALKLQSCACPNPPILGLNSPACSIRAIRLSKNGSKSWLRTGAKRTRTQITHELICPRYGHPHLIPNRQYRSCSTGPGEITIRDRHYRDQRRGTAGRLVHATSPSEKTR